MTHTPIAIILLFLLIPCINYAQGKDTTLSYFGHSVTKGKMLNGLKQGEWGVYSESGGLTEREVFEAGICIKVYYKYPDSMRILKQVNRTRDTLTMYSYDSKTHNLKSITKFKYDISKYPLNSTINAEDGTYTNEGKVYSKKYDYEAMPFEPSYIETIEEYNGLFIESYYFEHETPSALRFKIKNGKFVYGKRKEFNKLREIHTNYSIPIQ